MPDSIALLFLFLMLAIGVVVAGGIVLLIKSYWPGDDE